MGEVPAAVDGPQLLIVRAPQVVRRNQPFTISVSTRNLKRDRFLAAAKGGYYLESSFLNADGIVRGHFHSACRLLERTDRAPAPTATPPAFFVATEDQGGSKKPDVVKVNVPGLSQPGLYQCASWAGDGSHRIPMMQNANQVPAFDAIRLIVI